MEEKLFTLKLIDGKKFAIEYYDQIKHFIQSVGFLKQNYSDKEITVFMDTKEVNIELKIKNK